MLFSILVHYRHYYWAPGKLFAHTARPAASPRAHVAGTVLYYTILYYTILYYTILYYTIQ